LYNEKEEVIDRWFGGGTDLTPYYLFEEDAKHFHETYKNVCDEFDLSFYPKFKKDCDNYFVNTHRNNERRGIGGIFYDYLKSDEKHDVELLMNFSKACGDAFLVSYLPVIEKRKNLSYTYQQKHWQEIRRGRYVEFNLIHDRGTLFGLKTNGRTESILMSLPPTVRFEYNYQPENGSEEEKLLKVCLQPEEWI
jgi:coproporphyrinogen III oxidase